MFLIKQFVASTIHLGHKITQWNPRTSYFLLGIRDGNFIIDLEQTLIMLGRALALIKKICLKRGYIYYVTSQQGIHLSSFYKKSIANSHFHFLNLNLVVLSPESISSSKHRGMLYTFSQKRITCFWNGFTSQDFSKTSEASKATISSSSNLTDSVNSGDSFSNLSSGTTLGNLNIQNQAIFVKPEILFVLQTSSNQALIKQAVKFQIPIIGILDSNSNPYAINYPIPGNSDSIQALNLYTELLISTIISSKTSESQVFLSSLSSQVLR